MRQYAGFLYRQRSQNVEIAATLTRLELPNLVALLAQVASSTDPEATVQLTAYLQRLLENLGRPLLLARVGEVRDAAAARISETWSHARFDAERSRIEEWLASGRLREALAGAQALLRQAHTAGEHAYAHANYDIATACWLLGRVLQKTGSAQPALLHLDEAQRRFEAVEQAELGASTARMAAVCLTERGNCLQSLGRLDEAAAAYEESIHRDHQRGRERDVAIGKVQLGTVRLLQRRYQETLEAYAEARELFTWLSEPRSVAVIWHQMGIAYQEAGEHDAAEDAYRQSLAIEVRLGDVRGQAGTLVELGNLYDSFGRLEEATALYRTAADHFDAVGDVEAEGRCMSNLGDTLCKLRRWDEARQAIHRAIECKAPFGHAAEPWNAWRILSDVEAGAGQVEASARAKARVRACYLAYRRDGGENHNDDGRVSRVVTTRLLAGNAAGTIADLDELLAQPELPSTTRSHLDRGSRS